MNLLESSSESCDVAEASLIMLLPPVVSNSLCYSALSHAYLDSAGVCKNRGQQRINISFNSFEVPEGKERHS